MLPWLYRWLPIIFGCHCRPDRSFYYHGRKFPICARCTGELGGILLGLLSGMFYLPPWWAAAAWMVPMVADGFIQLLSRYESTNPRRLVTGLLFGYGFAVLFLLSSLAAFQHGYRFGQSIW